MITSFILQVSFKVDCQLHVMIELLLEHLSVSFLFAIKVFHGLLFVESLISANF